MNKDLESKKEFMQALITKLALNLKDINEGVAYESEDEVFLLCLYNNNTTPVEKSIKDWNGKISQLSFRSKYAYEFMFSEPDPA